MFHNSLPIWITKHQEHNRGLVQERRNSRALAFELCLFALSHQYIIRACVILLYSINILNAFICMVWLYDSKLYIKKWYDDRSQSRTPQIWIICITNVWLYITLYLSLQRTANSLFPYWPIREPLTQSNPCDCLAVYHISAPKIHGIPQNTWANLNKLTITEQ